MGIGIVGHVADMAPDQFDALDQMAGAAACHGRIQQKETDGRWQAKYLRWVDGGRLRAAIPLYTCRGRTWPDPAYDPGTWDLPGQIRDGCTPWACVLVGGCCDRRSGLHVDGCWRGQAELRRLLAAIAGLAAEQDRCLVFPYAFSGAKDALTHAADGRIVWTLLGREAHLRWVSDPAAEDSLPSRIRYVLRRDRRLIGAAGLASAVRTWPDVEDEACGLIAGHNARKGQRDHPEFVRMRNREWDQCGPVELVVFTARSDAVSGVLTALVWKDQLELYEIGLSGDEGPGRLAAYLDLVFHQPIRLARSRGLRSIRAGLAAPTPKAARGAVFEDLYGGVLDAAHTRKLGRDEQP